MKLLSTRTNGSDANTLAASSQEIFMSQTITINFISAGGKVTTLDGKVGKSLMQVATSHNIDGIAADCGGLMSCATCHVFVQEPFAAQLVLPDSEELAMLAFTAEACQPNSRLSCQITLTADLNGLTVRLPVSQY